jgi:hypothetical protein
MLRAELRGTKYYVALGTERRGRLFLLGSGQKAEMSHNMSRPSADKTGFRFCPEKPSSTRTTFTG